MHKIQSDHTMSESERDWKMTQKVKKNSCIKTQPIAPFDT